MSIKEYGYYLGYFIFFLVLAINFIRLVWHFIIRPLWNKWRDRREHKKWLESESGQEYLRRQAHHETYGHWCIERDQLDKLAPELVHDESLTKQFSELLEKLGKVVDRYRPDADKYFENENKEIVTKNMGAYNILTHYGEKNWSSMVEDYNELLKELDWKYHWRTYGWDQVPSYKRPKEFPYRTDKWIFDKINAYRADVRKLLEELNRTLTSPSILGGEGYKYQMEAGILSLGFKEKKINCHGFVTIYLSLAEKKDLPLYAVLVPGHILMLWQDHTGFKIYWEVTNGTEASVKTLAIAHGVVPWAWNKVYLHPLSYSTISIYSVFYNNRGGYFFDKAKTPPYNIEIGDPKERKEYERKFFMKAREDYERAIDAFEYHVQAHSNLAVTLDVLGEKEEAKIHRDKVNELDSNYYEHFKNKKDTY